MNSIREWHRLFGLFVTDFCTNSPFEVELEKDLSLKQQYLDVVVVRKKPGAFSSQWPDGMEDLGDHNLISFKSYQEAYDAWAMDELLGHYVNYRKHVSPDPDHLLPDDRFRLFAVSSRFPQQLHSQFALQQIQPGVLQTQWGSQQVRIIVARDLPNTENNALIHLFSADPNKVQYGQEHWKLQSGQTSTLILQLVHRYQHEGVTMPYTMEEFQAEFKKRFLASISDDEKLEGIPTEKRLEGIPPKKRFEGLTKEQIRELLQSIDDDQTNPPTS